MAVDASGNLYIADTGNNRIVKVDPSGGLSCVAGLFSFPYAVAVNAAGTIFKGNREVVGAVELLI